MMWTIISIFGMLLMLTVAGIIGTVEIIAISLGLIIGSVLIAPMWAARRHIHDKH